MPNPTNHMLRGHIEQIIDGVISGWVFHPRESLRGHAILAFDHDECIGAGEIGRFREDLRDAGLGDGHLGFEICCDPATVSAARLLNVRLQDSDFLMLHASAAALIQPRPTDEYHPFSPAEEDRLQWLGRHGWLTQGQLAFARALSLNGRYLLTLSRDEAQPGVAAGIAAGLLCATISTIVRKGLRATPPRQLAATELHAHLQSLGALAFEERFVALWGVPMTVHMGRGIPTGQPAPRAAEQVAVCAYHVLLCYAPLIQAIQVPQGDTVQLIQLTLDPDA